MPAQFRHIRLVAHVALIAAAGGARVAAQSIVHSADGRATLAVRAGAAGESLLRAVRIVAMDDRTDPAAVRASQYRIEADSAVFADGATLTIRFDTSDAPGGVPPSALAIVQQGADGWRAIVSVTSPGQVSATVRHGGAVAVRWHAPAAPCATPPFHALDFRIGEWNYRAAGFDPGHTVVERDASGCALVERYADNTGGRAYAFFIYDVRDGRWRSTTYDPGGRSIATGAPEGSRMVFYRNAADREVYAPQSDSSIVLTGERSSDGGRTWSAWFRAIYTRDHRHSRPNETGRYRASPGRRE